MTQAHNEAVRMAAGKLIDAMDIRESVSAGTLLNWIDKLLEPDRALKRPVGVGEDWQPGDPRCDTCDNGLNSDWIRCPFCESKQTRDIP